MISKILSSIYFYEIPIKFKTSKGLPDFGTSYTAIEYIFISYSSDKALQTASTIKINTKYSSLIIMVFNH